MMDKRSLQRYRLAAAFYLGGVLTGALSVFLPGAEQALLPAQALDALHAGRLWFAAPGGDHANWGLFLFIAAQNSRTALLTWLGGLLVGIGSAVMLFENGLFGIGAPLALSFKYGVGKPFLIFLAGHYPLELLGISLAGTGGLLLGDAVLEIRADWRACLRYRPLRQAVLLFLLSMPCFLLAAWLESHLSLGAAPP